MSKKMELESMIKQQAAVLGSLMSEYKSMADGGLGERPQPQQIVNAYNQMLDMDVSVAVTVFESRSERQVEKIMSCLSSRYRV